jgi:hypothetical protein
MNSPPFTCSLGYRPRRRAGMIAVVMALSLVLAVDAPVAKESGDSSADAPSAISREQADFFEAKIRPVLVQHCYECHAADSKIIRGGLMVDSRDALRAGGDSGPAVIPGQIEESVLLEAIRHQSYEMPPDKKLSAEVIADFEAWIAGGAADPRDEAAAASPRGVDWDAARSHWAFQRIADPLPPQVNDSAWVQNAIDRFILQRLEEEQMRPAPPADKRTLIRRATFDLIGLPPTPQEVDAFLADQSPQSFAKVVDRLLDSPHYGERWGRHWLDLVRYGDTNGADENHALPEAWRYRDWVVRMLNRDLPLDRFITEQLAGDLLPQPEDEQAAGDLLTATGMLVIGPKMLAEQDKDKMIIDIVDEQVDTVSRTMLGLTIGCARCHDHKFDPISAKDYYALAAIFYSTQSMADRAFVSNWMQRPLPSAEITAHRTAHQQRIDAAKAELAGLEASLASLEQASAQQVSPQQDNTDAPDLEPTAAEQPTEPSELEQRKQQIAAQKESIEKLEKEMPSFVQVMAVAEGEPKDLAVHIRGNHLTLAAEEVPRGMPEILSGVAAPPAINPQSSGREQLAQWLVSPEHPLTARVMANRIWMWHFGEALVRSPSNFGLMGEPPTHPQLLDWLAGELMRQGWSLKQLHRLVMLSATYQMSSQSDPVTAQRDPENRLWSRQNRRRLEAEPVRDAVLAVGGALDMTLGGKAPDTASHRRAVYLPINRSALYEMFSTFDYVETANHIEQRPTTTVPHQALFLLNSPLVHQQAERVARQVIDQSDDAAVRVDALFERFYARPPTAAQRVRALEFINQAEQSLTSQHDAGGQSLPSPTAEQPSQAEPVEAPSSDARQTQAWAALCRALIAGNEFIYID